MVQYDLNKVYVGETKQDVFKKKPNTSDIAILKMAKIHGQIGTSRKILSQEMTICIVEALIFIFYKL